MANKSKFSELSTQWESLYKSGKTFREIGTMFGCGHSVVRRRILKFTKTNSRSNGLMPDKEYFDKRVIKNGTKCWGWKGSLNSNGYGQGVSEGKPTLAHILSYKIHFGNPVGLFVCHKCDNPVCSNPDHLFLGTSKDNLIDCMLKGRGNNKHGKSIKLIKEIKQKIKTTSLTNRQISEIFEVRADYVRKIRAGYNWSYL